ncbi:DUF1924 domain-containing protein [Propylenella binzhouense]|uniref:DUF1924 domain-containing protein n=1 Tax=Propylenella binzhouense TaxID=2555902 RepID=A0A964T6D8_9HYPH|nr:DUF1924 domain-containing protein [Propylenella binzhouense]MYZ49381.1 DUF1924 domain-containing protein [Propylenella binzhouense]
MRATPRSTFAAGLFAVAAATGPAAAGPAQQAILDHYAAEAKAAGAPSAFSAARGEAFFRAKHGVSAESPSCSACHTADPRNPGRTRAGKPIEPMAVSAVPTRFTDLAEVEKWFRRNCNTVLGRACTPAEKGDFVAFMASR